MAYAAALCRLRIPPLREYYAHEAERGGWVRRISSTGLLEIMTASSGSWPWDRGLGTADRALRRAGLGAGMRVLDVGVGTGLTASASGPYWVMALQEKVTGIDPSSGMLESAKVPAGVELLLGCAETIPVEAETADSSVHGIRAMPYCGPVGGLRVNSCAC